ncbi:MAG TPA: phosphopantothenoylcysteine decarboxylase [Myxococcota bacterium]|nr:phosphopantothenoylcysteine decarboxylase [Myxococcota bacterium]
MDTSAPVVVTAGGTREPLDDVRAITNSSTGRFGAELARALHHRGAPVVLIGAAAMEGLVRELPADVDFRPFRSSAELAARLDEIARDPVAAVLMAAAVADYLPEPATGKIRSDLETLDLRLRRAPKLLTGLRARFGPETRLVGFKLLSGATPERLVEVASGQRAGAALDATFANDLRELGGPRHPGWWVTASGAERLDGAVADVAGAVADRVLDAPAPRVPSVGGWPRAGRWAVDPGDGA